MVMICFHLYYEAIFEAFTFTIDQKTVCNVKHVAGSDIVLIILFFCPIFYSFASLSLFP